MQLSEKMQERLDKWRKNTIPVASAEKVRGPMPSGTVRRGDYGDDIADFEKKNDQAWAKQQLADKRMYGGR